MPKVKMYRDVEGDTKVGEIADVSVDRAEFLVVHGYATYVNKKDAKHLPPVGGLRPKGRTIGVEGTSREGVQTYEEEKKGSPAGEGTENAPAEGTAEPAEEGPNVRR